jgi:D-alanyl-D-alanine carboxypeptidase
LGGRGGSTNRAPRKPLAPDATFRIASVTKTFTAAAILRLVERGRLALEDPISRHLSPAIAALLRQGGYDVDAIRVSHLLRHTSGLAGDYAQLPAYLEFIVSHPRHRWTRAEQVRFVIDRTSPLAPPGAEEHYSNTGYILLGEILERATGRRLAAACRSLLGFARLGLDETYLETRERKPAAAKPRAHQYIGNIDTTRFNPSFDLHGAGGHVSTLDDLVRFYRALLGGRFFKRAATLRTNQMGIDRTPIGDAICYGHGGSWGVAAYHCPRSGVTIAAMINQADGFIGPISRLLVAAYRLARREAAAGATAPAAGGRAAPPSALRSLLERAALGLDPNAVGPGGGHTTQRASARRRVRAVQPDSRGGQAHASPSCRTKAEVQGHADQTVEWDELRSRAPVRCGLSPWSALQEPAVLEARLLNTFSLGC